MREPIHCELVPVLPGDVQKTLFAKTPTAATVILDVGANNAVRVVDANTKVLIASDWLAHVTAKPTQYRFADENHPSYKQPLLDVRIPGMQPLRIGARPMGRRMGAPQFRYGWRGWVRGYKEPAYVVTEDEWFALAARFGLAARVIDETAAGTVRRVGRVLAMTWLWWGLPLFMLAGWLFHHFVR